MRKHGRVLRNRNQATNKKKQSHELNGLLCELCVVSVIGVVCLKWDVYYEDM